MLSIAMQRGLLHHLLDWVDLALRVSATAQSEAKKGVENKYGLINGTFYKALLAQMIEKTCSVSYVIIFFFCTTHISSILVKNKHNNHGLIHNKCIQMYILSLDSLDMKRYMKLKL